MIRFQWRNATFDARNDERTWHSSTENGSSSGRFETGARDFGDSDTEPERRTVPTWIAGTDIGKMVKLPFGIAISPPFWRHHH